MHLQRGITGFYGHQDPLPLPSTDLKKLRTHCYLAARSVGASVQTIKDWYDGFVMCNFAVARFEFSDSTVTMLINAVYPVIAFVKRPDKGQVDFEYIDCPKLGEFFQSFGEYLVATSEELNQPLVRDLWKDLTLPEQERIRYFGPARIGDVIFNFWD